MPRISELRKDAIKQAIYEAAVAVLTREGVDQTTMEGVASEAGVAKGSLYNYFRSKDDLLGFVFEKTVGPLEEEVDAIVDSALPTNEKLRDVFSAIYLYLEEHRKLFGFLLSQQVVHELTTPSHSPGLATLTSLIEQGIGEGVFRPCDATFHATLIYGAIRGVSDEYMTRDEPWPIPQMIEDAYLFCAAGLGRDAEASANKRARGESLSHSKKR